MMLSGAGVVFCLAFYLLAVSGIFAVPGKDAMLLFIGIFPIWLPTILFMGRLTSEFKQKDLWKAALRGCPSWMRVVLYVLIGAAFLAFLFPLLTGGKPGEGPFTFMLFPSTFYAISFCVMYSLLHAEEYDASRRCLNGHVVSPLAKFCDECGAPAGPPELRRPTLP